MLKSEHYDAGAAVSAGAAIHGAPLAGVTDARRLTELEQEIVEQRRQLSQAMEYLHEAAYLARYHQPALERHIRAFLNELESETPATARG